MYEIAKGAESNQTAKSDVPLCGTVCCLRCAIRVYHCAHLSGNWQMHVLPWRTLSAAPVPLWIFSTLAPSTFLFTSMNTQILYTSWQETLDRRGPQALKVIV